jgi:hypothetical protein
MLAFSSADASARLYERFCSAQCDPTDANDPKVKAFINELKFTLVNNDKLRIYDTWENGDRRFYATYSWNNGTLIMVDTGYAMIAGGPGGGGGGGVNPPGGGGGGLGGGGGNPGGGWTFQCYRGGVPIDCVNG